MLGSTHRQSGFIRNCEPGKRRKMLMFNDSQIGRDRLCMGVIDNHQQQQFPQFDYYSNKYNNRQQNNDHNNNNNDNSFSPFVFAKTLNKQQPIYSKIYQNVTRYSRDNNEYVANHYNKGYYHHHQQQQQDKLRVMFSPINQLSKKRDNNENKAIGRLVSNHKVRCAIKKIVNNNKSNDNNLYVNSYSPQQHLPLWTVNNSINYIHPFQLTVSQSQQPSFSYNTAQQPQQQTKRRQLTNRQLQQQPQQRQSIQQSVKFRDNRLQLNSPTNASNHRVDEINKNQNKSQLQQSSSLSSSSPQSNDIPDSSALTSQISDSYHQHGYHRQGIKYQNHHQVTQLNCVKQYIPIDQNKKYRSNVPGYNLRSNVSPINNQNTKVQYKFTPEQILSQIQNRTQSLKRLQQIQQYQQQGISLAKGGLTFKIDIKQFVFDSNNNKPSPKVYQSNQNQNSTSKATQNNAFISARSNKNNTQQKKSKKHINSKQELKRRRQLAKCYDRYARQKVFGSY